MKKIKYLFMFLLIISLFTLTSCELFPTKKKTSKEKEYKEEISALTGKWYLLDSAHNKTNTFFSFNGEKNKMTFSYTEDGETKSTGKFSLIYKANDGSNTYTVKLVLKRDTEEKEDYIYTYVDDFDTNFTQFSTLKIERDEDINDGRIYSHIYRMSELPYKYGIYVLENNEYKNELNNYKYKDEYQVPEGTYRLNDSVSITFMMTKPYHYALFRYVNGSNVVEGVYWTSDDKGTIYLYLEHDPYQYIRNEDREKYDMTFSHDYPPDFYLRGTFSLNNNSIVINDLYHHEYSESKVQDKIFKFGTYTREN